MSKRLIVTRSDANTAEMAAISHPRIKAYAERCGADFLQLDSGGPLSTGHGYWNYRIFRIRDLLKEYDRVLNIDTDTLVQDDCPNLFDVVPDTHIGVLLEDLGTRVEHRRGMMRLAQNTFGDIGWTEGYINSGVSLWSKAHAEVFRPIQGKLWMDWGLDDVHLGYRIHAMRLPVFPLPPTANWMSVFSEPWNGSAHRFNAHLIHYAGEAAFPDKGERNRLDLMRSDAERLRPVPDRALTLALVGVFTATSTDTQVANALTALGHRVKAVPYRDILEQRGMQHLASVLQAVVREVDGLVLFKGAGRGLPMIPPDLMATLPCPTLYWMPDNLELVGQELAFLARACSATASPCKTSCEILAKAGCRNVSQIFMTHDAGVFYPHEVAKTRDVTFIGELDGERGEWIARLRQDGIVVETPKAWLGDASRVMSESKISLNFTRGELLSNRVFFAMASGSFVFTSESSDLRAIGTSGVHFAEWNTYEELRDGIRYWLAHDAERERIAIAGMEVASRFTSEKQAIKLVRALEGERIFDGAYKAGGLA